MNSKESRNNVGSLRVRITPPRNNTGTKKIWNGYNWLSRSNALLEAKKKASEETKYYMSLNKTYTKLIDIITYYKSIGASDEMIDPLKSELNDVGKELNIVQKKTENSIMFYKNIANLPPLTPLNKRINRKTRKSNNRR